MKFFTRDYVEGRMSDAEADATHDRYARHLERLSLKLPSAVAALVALPLHDGLVDQVVVDRSSHSLTFAIVGRDLEVGYERLTLEYSPTELSQQDWQRLRDAAQDPETELLYDELDETPSGRFEHRILFTPHREVTIGFTNIMITRKRVPDRHVTTQPRQRFVEFGAT